MPENPFRSRLKNRILSRLSRADLALLRPHLVPVDLPVLTRLETGNARIDAVYFMDSGFASVVANGSGKRGIEVGVIGREGMTGLAVVMGNDRSPMTRIFKQRAAGSVSEQRSCAERLRKALPCIGPSCAMPMLSSFRPRRRRWPTAAARMQSVWRDGC